jgi:hypothetical protein
MIQIALFIIVMIISAKKVESIKCRPSNMFTHVFAPPGTGKTTLAAKIVRNSINSNKPVYSNVDIKGAYHFFISDLGKYEYKDCTLIIDEAGSEINNRDWKTNLNKKQLKFIKKHRHYNVDIYLFSQSYDETDKKFRDLTTRLLLLEKSMIPFMVKAKTILKKIDVVEGEILNFYYIPRFSTWRFFTPKCWAYFDTEEKDEPLPTKKNVMYTRNGII